MSYAAVVFNIAVDKAFHYSIPPHLKDKVKAGVRVRAPFRNQWKVGFVVGLSDTTDAAYTRPLSLVLDEEPLIDETFITLARWIADRYLCSWGTALNAMIPPGARTRNPRRTLKFVELARTPRDSELRSDKQVRIVEHLTRVKGSIAVKELCAKTGTTSANVKQLVEKGILRVRNVAAEPTMFDDSIHEAPKTITLTPEQEAALEAINHCPPTGTVVIHGVTGSGKTEVYLRAIQHQVDRGRSAIVLVPEIALTPQTVARFKSRFKRTAVLHSMMTAADRANEWRRAKEGLVDVVVGPRSAVFAPLKNLGLIVIDEEQENTYKQENDPRYHAREVALERARLEKAVVVVGSATPSLESYHHAKTGAYRLVTLPRRVEGRPMPVVEIVDMQQETADLKYTPIISRTLGRALEEAIAKKEQVILFLNRRGFASYLRCKQCGHIERCPRCDVTVTYHRESNRCVCHYCLTFMPALETCPGCHTGGLKFHGVGTERVEEEIRKRYPQLSVTRMDSDAMKSRQDYEDSIGGLWSGMIDVVVGTQMIAKGHDMPNVTLVGVISADTAFNLPDFRSSERTFQLITQVAGRAGRSDKPGRVVVQTFNPKHYSVVCAATYNFSGFAEKELAQRAELGYPPFSHLVRIVLESKTEDTVKNKSKEFDALLRRRLPSDLTILGPHPAPLYRLQNRYRMHTLIKSHDLALLLPKLRKIDEEFNASGDLRVVLDVDPVSML